MWANMGGLHTTEQSVAAIRERQSKVKYTDLAARSLTCHTATGTHIPLLYSSLFVKKNDSIGKIQKNVTKLQKKQIKKLK